jgi:hypothetical protein
VFKICELKLLFDLKVGFGGWMDGCKGRVEVELVAILPTYSLEGQGLKSYRYLRDKIMFFRFSFVIL